MMHVPWPIYPAVLAWCIGFIIQVIMLREIDHGKVALFKATPTGGHYLKGRLGTEILTERGLRLHRWFMGCMAVFIISLAALALYAKR
jgi:hypothetical protein